MPNRLAAETSPYLLQHQDNPVDWYPWGPEALARARAEDKAIFLSIGYSACHWCHVMAHESFENPEIARLLNERFINVKVDREERPDLDSIYMSAVVALTGHGGWPMSVWLTPEGVPFYGGTYFPPAPRGGMPAFSQVILGVHDAWVNRRQQVLDGGRDIVQHLGQTPTASEAGLPTRADLAEAVKALWAQFDWRHHGWGGAPKFPQPMTIEFCLRYHLLTGERTPLEMATKTLHSMARGGMYDQLGGGFHRYSVDAVWLVPHFEKMLYDNAQLARVYLHAYQLTGDPAFRTVCADTLAYVLREMTDPAGGFYSAQDADSEGEEGKFFIWREAEIDGLLGADAALFKTAYGVTAGGNFEGHTILFRPVEVEAVAPMFGLEPAQAAQRLATARARLFAQRAERVKPGLDDKVLTAWNGLMLAAMAEAGQVLGRADFLAAARANADFLLREMRVNEAGPDHGRLRRTWRAGQARLNGYLEDYAFAAEGLLAIYQATFDERYFTAARDLAEHMLARFADANGGFYDTSDDHEALVFRPKDQQDNATPSGAAMATTVLLKLAAYTGDARYAEAAIGALAGVAPYVTRYPTGFAQWLNALTFELAPAREVALVGPAGAALDALTGPLLSRYHPFHVVAWSPDPAHSHIPLLLDRQALGGAPTAYVCRHFACQLPVTEVAALEGLLAQA